MSIPIAARRYISELGLAGWKWKRFDSGQDNGYMAALILKEDKKFCLTFGMGNPKIGWKVAVDEGWIPVFNVVCWSEIKI